MQPGVLRWAADFVDQFLKLVVLGVRQVTILAIGLADDVFAAFRAYRDLLADSEHIMQRNFVNG